MADGEQGRQVGFWQGMAEQVALSLLAMQGLQELALGLGFYPFRRDGHAEGAGQLDYGTAQLAAVLVVGQRLDEGPVYLNAIDGQAPEQAQGGETGAEVVDGDRTPSALRRVKSRRL